MSEFALIAYQMAPTGFTWWNVLPSAVGAVLGAASSAIPAYWLANRASKATLRRDEQARVQAEKSATVRGMIKMQVIVNGLEGLHREVHEMIADAQQRGGDHPEVWTMVRGLTGLPGTPVQFNAEEIAIFLAFKDYEFFNDLLVCGTRYNALTAGFAEYTVQRQKLTDLLSAKMEGIVGSTDLSPENAAFIAPKAAAVESLIAQLIDTTEIDYEAALALAEQFGPKARSCFNDVAFPAMDVSEARRQAAERRTAKAVRRPRPA